MLSIRNLHADVAGKEIPKRVAVLVPAAFVACLAAPTAWAQSTPSCQEQISRREKAFEALKAEMDDLRRQEDGQFKGRAGYPPLNIASRYLALQEKLQAFDKAYPAPSCEAGEQDGSQTETSHASN